MKDFSSPLGNLKSQNRLRTLKLPDGIDLSSNDYLGLRNHATLRQAALEALQNGMDLGAGGSRLLRGHTSAHQNLETFAAHYYGFEAALYFANGFTANYALFTALPTRHDVVVYDAYVHASVRDGLHASTAQSVKVPHNDLNAFEDALKRHRDKAETLYIALESLYSMDGDFAPLEALYALARQYDAILIVDEAHAGGIWGPHGQGLSETLPRENLIVVHTCGKALGVAGGLVCASSDVIHMLINTARPFIYSTAPPPLQAFLTQKAMGIAASEEGDIRRSHLKSLCAYARKELGGSGSQIIPIILGEDKKAVQTAQTLQEQGFDIRAIRPPTVPDGTARLRLSLNTGLSEQILCDFFAKLRPFLLEQTVS
jgi:8-amino-7-oxononanoate synthase